MTPHNVLLEAQGAIRRCLTCRLQARSAQDATLIYCLVKGCKRHTRRATGGNYVCPIHRAAQPGWFRNFRLVGTQLLPRL